MSSGLRLDLRVPCDRFEVAIQWESDERALGLFGPSGAGKSTVLEAIAGIRRGVTGRIEIGGVRWLDSGAGFVLPPERRGVGYVPQELALFPHLDVLGNVRFGERRRPAAAAVLSPARILDLLELGGLARRPVTELSGGERQRVALGRALCSGPALLLLDEPLAGLDLPLRRRILPYLVRIREEFSIPTLFVSHEPAEVSLLCAEVTELRQGRVVGRGAPADLFRARASGRTIPATRSASSPDGCSRSTTRSPGSSFVRESPSRWPPRGATRSEGAPRSSSLVPTCSLPVVP